MTFTSLIYPSEKAQEYLLKFSFRNLFKNWEDILKKVHAFTIFVPEKLHMRKVFPHYDYFNPKAGRLRFYPNSEGENDISSELQKSEGEDLAINTPIDINYGFFTTPAKITESLNDQGEKNGYWEEISKGIDIELVKKLYEQLDQHSIYLTDLMNDEDINISNGITNLKLSNKSVYSVNSKTTLKDLQKLFSSLSRPESLMIFLTKKKMKPENIDELIENSEKFITFCCDGEAYLISTK
jgi:hypothetical protein